MIPLEIIRDVVCSFLDVKDIATLARGCCEWAKLMDDEMYAYLCERDFKLNKEFLETTYGIKSFRKLYKKYFVDQIVHQDFNGIQVWKPRVGNHIHLKAKGWIYMSGYVIKAENDRATLSSKFRKHVLVFCREYGRWEWSTRSTDKGFIELEYVKRSSDGDFIRHDWKK